MCTYQRQNSADRGPLFAKKIGVESPNPVEPRGTAHRILNKNTNTYVPSSSKAISIDQKNILTYKPYSPQKRVQLNISYGTGTGTTLPPGPNDAEAYIKRGNEYRKCGKFNEAIADFTKATQINSKYSQVYINLGGTFHELSKFNQAIYNYSKAIELDPTCAKAFNNRGLANKSLKRNDEAESDFKNAVKLCPGDPLYLFNWAKCLLQQSKKNEAKDIFERAIESFSSWKEHQLKDKFGLRDVNIKYIQDLIQDYSKLKQEIQEIEELSKKQGRKDIFAKAIRLAQKNQELSIQASMGDSSVAQALAKIHSQLQNLKSQLKQKDQKIMKLENRVDKVEDQLQEIRNQVEKMNKKVFAVDRVIEKIKGLDSRKQEEYYDKFYRVVIDHFLAYRIAATQFFHERPRCFSKGQKALQKLCRAHPVIKIIPIIGQLVMAPFQLLYMCMRIRSQQINDVIGKKIGASNFKAEANITETMAFVIEKLIENRQFNQKMMEAVKKEEGSYLNGCLKKMNVVREEVFEELLGAKRCQFSYVQLVITAHATLLTKALLQVDPFQFKKISQSPELFYSFVLQAIDPQLQPSTAGSKQIATRMSTKRTLSMSREKQLGKGGKACKCIIY